MSAIKELIPNIYQWSEYSEEKQLNFNGYFLAQQDQSVFIDPPSLTDDGLQELKELVSKHSDCPLKAILLTNVHHDRMSQKLKEVFSSPIYIHENDQELLDFTPDHTFRDGETLFCGLKAIHIKDQKSPGETAFLLEDRKILFVGDALIGKVPGKLNLLPPDKYPDITKAKKALEILKNYDFNDLLLGDGEPILGEAQSSLHKLLRE